MRTTLWVATIAGLTGLVTLFVPTSNGEPVPAQGKQPVRKASGLEKRELWTTSKVKGSPEPPAPYRMAKAFPKVSFTRRSNSRPCRARRRGSSPSEPGKILTFDADPDKAKPKLVLDVKHTIYGVVLHPKFQENGFIYVSEVPDGSKETPDGTPRRALHGHRSREDDRRPEDARS